MADESDDISFDEQSARRIVRSVLQSERASKDLRGQPTRRGNPEQETCWAKLTNEIDTGKFEWTEVIRSQAGDGSISWVTKDGGRSGDNSRDDPGKMLAVFTKAADDDSTVTVSTPAYVLLRRAWTIDEDDESWIPCWIIVSMPLPKGNRNEVFQIMDDNNTWGVGPVLATL